MSYVNIRINYVYSPKINSGVIKVLEIKQEHILLQVRMFDYHKIKAVGYPTLKT